MNQSLCEAPAWLVCAGFSLLMALLFLLVWHTDRLARNAGRLAGLREADQRNRQQQAFDYTRGKCDGIRDALAWLRQNGGAAGVAEMPASLLDKTPSHRL